MLRRIKFKRRPSQTACSSPSSPSTASTTFQHQSGTPRCINTAALAFCATRELLRRLISPLSALEHAEQLEPSTTLPERWFLTCSGRNASKKPPFVQKLRNCTCSSLLCGSCCLSKWNKQCRGEVLGEGRVELEEEEAEAEVFAEVDVLLLIFCRGDLMDWQYDDFLGTFNDESDERRGGL